MADDELRQKAAKIQLLLFDVDGVFTDGGVILGSQGFEAKRFNIQDGMGVTLAREGGFQVGIMTGRTSEAVSRRAAELRMDVLVQGSKDKVEALEKLCDTEGLRPEQILYMGDDVQDLGILTRCGVSMAPSNGRPEVRDRVDWVTQAPGGHGAVREAIEAMLRWTDRWDRVLEGHLV